MTKLAVTPIMLPTTDKSAPLWEWETMPVLRFNQKDSWSAGDVGNRHLYFVSDRKIEEQDWVLITYSKLPNYRGSAMGLLKWDRFATTLEGEFKKIEATTDPTLGLPLIPLQWVKDVYVEAGLTIEKKIKRVFIDIHGCCIDAAYNCICEHRDQPGWNGQYVVSITPLNQVIITKVKESYTEQELRNVARSCWQEARATPNDTFEEFFEKLVNSL